MKDLSDLIKQLGHLETEQINPRTIDIDQLSAFEIAQRINSEDKIVASAVEKELEHIAELAEIFADTIKQGHRVFYVGAGTSGRLGVLDAAECPPTFGSDNSQIVGIISGGYETLVLSKEGVEDDREAAKSDLRQHSLSEHDLVIGIAASSRTPYTLSAVDYAKQQGCQTALIICNSGDGLTIRPDVLIALEVGPEVISGSTRMKSGTAQKMALNMISTTAMILLGKTFGNLMVDLQAKSDKLSARSRKILIDLLGLTNEQVESLIDRAEGSVKLAIVMHSKNCDMDRARELLGNSNGSIKNAIAED